MKHELMLFTKWRLSLNEQEDEIVNQLIAEKDNKEEFNDLLDIYVPHLPTREALIYFLSLLPKGTKHTDDVPQPKANTIHKLW